MNEMAQNRKLGNLSNLSFSSNFDSSFNLILKKWQKKNKQNEAKTKRFQYNLGEKMKISEMFEVSILPYTQNWKLANLGYLFFSSKITAILIWYSKTTKK